MTPEMEPERVFEEFQPPSPQPELRSSVLSAAGTALARSTDRLGVWTRIWDSTSLRIAWAATVLALLLSHALLLPGLLGHAPGGPVQPLFLVAQGSHDSELAEIIDLDPLNSDTVLGLESALDRSADNDVSE